MGRHIIQISRWSGRSLFMAYSRLMTLIFALFCAATGQLPKTTTVRRAEATTTIFKGTAYRAADSTKLAGIKLFLQDCFSPLYGIYPEYGVSPLYGVITPVYGVATPAPLLPVKRDSVVTDENGYFELVLDNSNLSDKSITSEVVTDAAGKTVYTFSDCVFIKEGTDSTYTLYLNGNKTAVEKAARASRQPAIMTALQGQELQIRIPEWIGKSGSASIVNSLGQEVASMALSADGSFRWNTRTVAKGVYFFQTHGGGLPTSVRILVK